MSWIAAGTVGASVVSGLFGMGKSRRGDTQQQSTYNPELDKYTQSYRAAAPWLFASLDPTAYIESGQAAGLGAEFKKNLRRLSDSEKQELTDTNAALARIKTRQESGQFLTPKETEFINTNLDKAFEYAHKVGYADWERGAQSLAGERGLRTGDTSVAKPAMEELRNLQIGLGSKRAEMGLTATMQMSQQMQEFDKSFVEFNKTLAFNRMSARQGFMFGGGAQGVAGIRSNVAFAGSRTESPSMFQNIGSGMNLGSQVGSMFMSGRGGTGSLSGNYALATHGPVGSASSVPNPPGWK